MYNSNRSRKIIVSTLSLLFIFTIGYALFIDKIEIKSNTASLIKEGDALVEYNCIIPKKTVLIHPNNYTGVNYGKTDGSGVCNIDIDNNEIILNTHLTMPSSRVIYLLEIKNISNSALSFIINPINNKGNASYTYEKEYELLDNYYYQTINFGFNIKKIETDSYISYDYHPNVGMDIMSKENYNYLYPNQTSLLFISYYWIPNIETEHNNVNYVNEHKIKLEVKQKIN